MTAFARAARRLVLPLAVSLMPLASGAAATSIHYNFENTGANPAATDNVGHDFLQFNHGGVGLTITAEAETSSLFWGIYSPVAGSGKGVYFGDTGLGVFQGGTDNNNMDGGADPGDYGERLTFSFDRVVTLTAVNFGRWDGRDNYLNAFDPFLGDLARFQVDGIGVYNHRAINDHALVSLTGRVFTFNADDDNSSFRIQDIDIAVQDLPEPGSLAWVAAALLVLGQARRRRAG